MLVGERRKLRLEEELGGFSPILLSHEITAKQYLPLLEREGLFFSFLEKNKMYQSHKNHQHIYVVCSVINQV